MPGFDRTGPMGSGPLTGRGRGRCRRPADEPASMEDPYQYYGIGWGYSPWPEGGSGRFRGRGWGRGRGSGRGRGFGGGWRGAWDFLGPGAGEPPRETFLIRRIDELIAALDRVKELLSKHSSGEGEDRR